MAIARGAGTEIISSASFDYSASNKTVKTLIFGEQHHIYTVLSIFVHAQTSSGAFDLFIKGYDSLEGTTQQSMYIFNTVYAGDSEGFKEGQTWVWADPFSFNGHEPTNFSGPMDNATKQDAIIDQGSSVPQLLQMQKHSNASNYNVHITFIDQNNA